MKFAHLSDCHLGGWREPRLRDANTKAFNLAVDKILAESVDFVLIAGDLFNTAVPSIESLKTATRQLKRLKDNGIPVYFIAGSHDFSPSGKTMLDVLAHAGLAKNVAQGEETEDNRIRLKFTVDEKTGAKMTGMIGKKGGLEKEYYHLLAKDELEKESGFKIFLFHSALAELKPKGLEQMDAIAVSSMPAGFDYYAGGHVHVVDKASLGEHKNVVYPGPVFPNNFAELEKLRQGTFVMYRDGEIEHVPLQPHPVVSVAVDVSDMTASEAEKKVQEVVAREEVKDAIVAIRVSGRLRQGRPSDIAWNDVFQGCYARNAYFVMRNANALTSTEFEGIQVKEANVEEVENALLKEHASQFKLSENDIALAKKVMQSLSAEKGEGERVTDFETRVSQELDKLFEQ